jgi:ferric-dicitrate binding protein FerR (iron transport regulator)
MSSADFSTTLSDRRLRQAAAWRIRLQYADFTTRLHERWEAWIEIPENRRAFTRIERLWATLYERHLLCEQNDGRFSAARRLASLLCDLAFRFLLSPRRAIWIMASAAVLAMSGAVVELSDVFAATTPFQLQVAPRQPATSPPPDIEVEVAHGKAVFLGANDWRRRIVVTTDLARIEGTGTEFSVSNTEQSIVVTVAEGVVEISPTGRGAGAPGIPRTLHKDQRLILPKNGSASTIQKVAVRTGHGWLSDLPWRMK